MSDTNSYEISASARNHPEARHVDAHLVVDRREWVPGKHPDPEQRYEAQTEYLDTYLQCIRCGIEVQNKSDLPVECDGSSRGNVSLSSDSVQPAVDSRTVRAATEHMTVIEEAQSLFSVTTQSGSEYTVDLREPACTCPDFEYRESVSECKHIRRVRIEVGQVDIEMLKTEVSKKADDLESSAAELEARARELTDTADELRDALNRIEEVAG
jgi:predicted nucleic acid-binding Zn finger protein